MKSSLRTPFKGVPFALGFVVCLLTTPAAFAAEPGAAVTLQELLARASQTHPLILEKRGNVEAAQFALSGAQWQRFPNVSAEASANPTQGATQLLRVEQPLWTGGRITANISANQARLQAAEASLIESEQEILTRTVSLFAELVRLGSRLDAARENISEHERLQGLIQRRSESGVASPSEVISATARLQQAQTEYVQLQTAAVNARAGLEELTGLSVSNIRVPKSELTVVDDVKTSVDKAVSFSPGLRRLASETLQAGAEIEARKAAFLPKLSLRHDRLWGSNSPTSQTYLMVTAQTGNGLSVSRAVSEARSQQSAAMQRESSLRLDIGANVRTDWNKVRSAKAEAEVLRELNESTREMYESFVRQYAAGRKFWLDVLNARGESIRARNSLVDAEWGGMLALWRLQIATGALTPASLDTATSQSDSIRDFGRALQIGMVQP